MALCIRYCKGLDIKERFLGFIDCSMKQDSESLSQLMLEYLKQCKLSPQVAIVAQSYDGASVMSGRFNGVQAKIKSKYPFAIYTHCMAHRINLVVLDMCKIVKVINFYSVFYNLVLLKQVKYSLLILRILDVFLIHWKHFIYIFPIQPITKS